jgi:hypothetical protein
VSSFRLKKEKSLKTQEWLATVKLTLSNSSELLPRNPVRIIS